MDALRLLSRSTGLKSRILKQNGHHIPSEGQLTSQPNGEQNRKRKRGSEEPEDAVDNEPPSEDQVRTIQKAHKVRIVNLLKYNASASSSSGKERKEKARVFPPPLVSFSQLQSKHTITKAISENVRDQSYDQPTEVQLATIPLLLENGKHEPDLLTVAPTGSGKTLAFFIPLIEKIRRSHQISGDEDARHVSAIILAPTKELVGQIVNEGRKLTARTGVTITAMKKGMRLSEQTIHHDSGASSDSEDGDTRAPAIGIVKSDIIVSTPLSIVHSLTAPNNDRVDLPNIKTLILDEADVLLDPLFREQTNQIWQACTSQELRISFWSATMGSNIEDTAVKEILDRRKRLGVRSKQPLLRVIVGLKDSSLPSINHKLVYAATEQGKLLGLRQIIHPSRSFPTSSSTKAATTSTPPPLRPPFLIFTQTITRAQALYTELQYDIPSAAGGSTRIAVLHSSLSSTQRASIMTRFRQGQIWILITTDLLSRGVDFRGVNGVVNYDIPTTVASYIHRAGRTGRAGREGGVCVTFYTREDVVYVKGIANVIAASQKNGGTGADGVEGLEKWVLDALPDLSKKVKKELKERGVAVRRGVKESDDAEDRRKKRKARIGTKSGYERKVENNRKGAVEGSQRRKAKHEASDDGQENGDDGWGGLSD